jgi:hypothetical protein
MPSKEESAYKVVHVRSVNEQIESLVQKASLFNRRQEVVSALEVIVHNLQARPLAYGDPEYRTRHPSGLVCHAVEPPLLARFVTYEAEKVVCSLYLQAMPHTFLA